MHEYILTYRYIHVHIQATHVCLNVLNLHNISLRRTSCHHGDSNVQYTWRLCLFTNN